LVKEINQYIRSKSITREIALFYDFSYWDYEEEFLKRFYNSREAAERILLLEGTMQDNADYFRHIRLF
jgi:hypothetical protein